MNNEELRDDQWARIKPLCPGTKGNMGRRGSDTRLFINALLWLARSGGRWKDLPERFGKAGSVKGRYYCWVACGAFDRIFAILSEDADTEWHIPDSTIVRAHQHAAGAPLKRGDRMPRALVEAGAGSPQRSTHASMG